MAIRTFELLEPVLNALIGILSRNIIDDNRAEGSTVILSCDGPVSLLAGYERGVRCVRMGETWR